MLPRDEYVKDNEDELKQRWCVQGKYYGVSGGVKVAVAYLHVLPPPSKKVQSTQVPRKIMKILILQNVDLACIKVASSHQCSHKLVL
jgi:hypothetical protein